MAGESTFAEPLKLYAGLKKYLDNLQGGAAPVTQNSIDSLNKGAPWGNPTPPVDNMLGTPNLAMNTPVPMPEKESPTPGSREVTHTTKPDGTEIKKIKDTVDEPKTQKTDTANGDRIPAGANGVPGPSMANAENTQSKTVGTTASRLVDLPPDVMAAYDALRKQREAQILDAQGASQDFMSSYEPRTDMSALLSFFGSQTGRDYMSGYKKPGGLNELVGMQDKLEENIAKAKTGLSDTELQYLKARMGLQETTKTSTTDSNKDMNAELLAKKLLAGDGLGGQKFDEQIKRDDKAAKKEYLTTKEFGPTLEAHDKIFQASANINKVLYARGGAAPLPGTEDATQFAQAAAELIYLVNQYDAGLGALAAADSKYLKKAIGLNDSEEIGEYLKSVYSPVALMEAMRRFQDKMKDSSLKRLKAVKKTYSDYPSVLNMITDTENAILPAIQEMELSRTGKGKGQTQSKKSAEDEEAERIYQSLSPEDKARVDKKLKGGG